MRLAVHRARSRAETSREDALLQAPDPVDDGAQRDLTKTLGMNLATWDIVKKKAERAVLLTIENRSIGGATPVS